MLNPIIWMKGLMSSAIKTARCSLEFQLSQHSSVWNPFNSVVMVTVAIKQTNT